MYGCLNIGAVEEYREYYGRFERLTLGVYEDWPDERWVDVSDAEWQTFLIQELAPKYAALGLDGFSLTTRMCIISSRPMKSMTGFAISCAACEI